MAREAPWTPVANALANALANEIGARAMPPDVVEVALANALEGARLAGEWALVAQLARDLEVRRLARLSVPHLESERRRREGR